MASCNAALDTGSAKTCLAVAETRHVSIQPPNVPDSEHDRDAPQDSVKGWDAVVVVVPIPYMAGQARREEVAELETVGLGMEAGVVFVESVGQTGPAPLQQAAV